MGSTRPEGVATQFATLLAVAVMLLVALVLQVWIDLFGRRQ
jgi:cellobiose-specific phosphotransferase system component IIC